MQLRRHHLCLLRTHKQKVMAAEWQIKQVSCLAAPGRQQLDKGGQIRLQGAASQVHPNTTHQARTVLVQAQQNEVPAAGQPGGADCQQGEPAHTLSDSQKLRMSNLQRETAAHAGLTWSLQLQAGDLLCQGGSAQVVAAGLWLLTMVVLQLPGGSEGQGRR